MGGFGKMNQAICDNCLESRGEWKVFLIDNYMMTPKLFKRGIKNILSFASRIYIKKMSQIGKFNSIGLCRRMRRGGAALTWRRTLKSWKKKFNDSPPRQGFCPFIHTTGSYTIAICHQHKQSLLQGFNSNSFYSNSSHFLIHIQLYVYEHQSINQYI